MSTPPFELGSPTKDTFIKAGSVPYLKLSTAGQLTAINGGGIATTALSAPWTAQPFNAAEYAGNNSMTVTVAAGDVALNRYLVIGKICFWRLVIVTATVGGTPSTQIQVTLPGGLTAANGAQGAYYYSDNNTPGIGFFQVGAGTCNFLKLDSGNWTASTDLTYIRAELFFEIA